MMIIRKMEEKHFEEVLAMMRIFYNTPAVLHKATDEILSKDIRDCIGDMPFIEGFIFEVDENVAGYSMVAKSYSTEYGGLCLWVEDIYLKPEYRSKGIAREFFAFLEERYKGQAVRFRLEAERSNENAINAYKKYGYRELPYMELTKEI